MRLHLQYIGPLREASIDLNHNFTLLTGPNNTGKTFAAYCVYGAGDIDSFIQNKSFFVQLILGSENSEDAINSYMTTIFPRINQINKSNLPNLFAYIVCDCIL